MPRGRKLVDDDRDISPTPSGAVPTTAHGTDPVTAVQHEPMRENGPAPVGAKSSARALLAGPPTVPPSMSAAERSPTHSRAAKIASRQPALHLWLGADGSSAAGCAMNSSPSAAARSRSACQTGSSSGDSNDNMWSSRVAPDRAARAVERHHRGKADEVDKPRPRAFAARRLRVGDAGGSDEWGGGVDLVADRLGQVQVPPLPHVERPARRARPGRRAGRPG